MSDVAVVTANFGGFDEPRGAVAQEGYEDADWYAFTPDLEQALGYPDPWEGIGAVNVPEAPRIAAKRYKLTPWRVLEHMGRDEGPYRWIVWLDASMEITSPRFLYEALASASCSGAPLTTFRHPRRNSVWREVMGSMKEAVEKYGELPLVEQAEGYRALGFPDDNGLFACGTLVWNMEQRYVQEGGEYVDLPSTGDSARVLGETWLAECERWTIQDQLSLPFVAWALGIDIGTFPQNQAVRYVKDPGYVENEWMRIWDHRGDERRNKG